MSDHDKVHVDDLSEKALRCMRLSNRIIEEMIDSTEDESLEIIAVVSSAFSAVKAGYYATGLEAGFPKEYLDEMISKMERTEAENYREVVGVAITLVDSGNRTHLDGPKTIN